MTIIDVENMTAAELKEKRAEIALLLSDQCRGNAGVAHSHDLSQRYVQARMDAKVRDEKLAEQGKTISALQDGTQAAKERVVMLQTELEKAKKEAAANHDSLKREMDAGAETCFALKTAESLAKARRLALADVMIFAAQLQAKVAPLLVQE